MIPESTLRCIYDIAAEEPWPEAASLRAILRVQASIDWSLWVRRVDLALVGGDPILLAARLGQLRRERGFRDPARVAILHPLCFSGAPLAALDDAAIRERAGIVSPDPGAADPGRDAVLRSVERDLAGVPQVVSGGVIAMDMVQGIFDAERGEIVLRLTRDAGAFRARGRRLSTGAQPQIAAPGAGPGVDVFERSRALFDHGLRAAWSHLSGLLEEPPPDRHFADIVVARRVEVLSGFISTPVRDARGPECLAGVRQFRLAAEVPRSVARAVEIWCADLDAARSDPIFAEE